MTPPGGCGALEGGGAWVTGGGGGARYTGRGPVWGMMTRRATGAGGGAWTGISGDELGVSIAGEAWATGEPAAPVDISGAFAAWFTRGAGACGLEG